jgi:hypothetical protein
MNEFIITTQSVEAAARGMFAAEHDRDRDEYRRLSTAALEASEARIGTSSNLAAYVASVVREEFSVEDHVGEYDATAIWGDPEDVVGVVLTTLDDAGSVARVAESIFENVEGLKWADNTDSDSRDLYIGFAQDALRALVSE